MSDIVKLKNVASSLDVLYVEDNQELLENFTMYLSKFFNSITNAKNGEEGLKLYKEKKFDIVITDINMPQLNGLSMASEIKKINSEQIIVVVSAYSESKILLESIKQGIEGYIIKPIDYEEINKVLYKLCINIKNEYENSINIEQQKQLMEHISSKNLLLKQYTEVIDKVAIVSKTDLKGVITEANQFFCDVSGYEKSELVGKNHNIVRHPDVPKSIYAQMWETIKAGKVWEGTVKNRAKNGDAYFVHATIIPMFDEEQNICEYIGIRFLATEEELEKREFRKKVRTSFVEYKKSNSELSLRVDALSKELSSKFEYEQIQLATIQDLNTRLKKANERIEVLEESQVVQKYTNNLDDITQKFKDSSRQLKLKKDELLKVQDDNDKKRAEIIRLNEELIKQHDIIEDLRDTIKNISMDSEEKKKEKKETTKKDDSFFTKYLHLD